MPWSRKLAYAAGGLAMNLTNLVISQWIYKRYVPEPALALVPVGLFGAIFFLGRVTDAITDPLVAFWSDKRSPGLGRRIPFLKWGTVPLALVFLLLWLAIPVAARPGWVSFWSLPPRLRSGGRHGAPAALRSTEEVANPAARLRGRYLTGRSTWLPPLGTRHWVNAVWALVLVQAYFVLYTVVVTPYLALLPEITSDLDERVNISTLQAVFVMVGTAIFAVIGVVIEGFGWAALGAVVAVLTVVSFLPTVLWVKERPTVEAAVEAAGLWRWIALTFRNRPFLHLLAATSFYWFGLNLLIMLVPYWVQDYLGLTEAQVPAVMGPFLAANLVLFVVFNALAKRIGKFATFLVTLAGSALVIPLLVAVGHLPFGGELAQTAVAMGLFGIPSPGFMMLPFALLADVVDHDEQLTGRRREAIYFGAQAITQKSMIGLSIFVFGWLVLGGETTNIAGLKAVPWVSAASFALGIVGFIGYPLRERAGRVVLRGSHEEEA